MQTDSIGDAWGFSGKTPISPSKGFSVEILIEVTLSWKTESNRSISAVEDRIPGWLQHCHKTMLRERWPPWKAGLYNLEMISPWGCNFWMSGLAYNTTTIYNNRSILMCQNSVYISRKWWYLSNQKQFRIERLNWKKARVLSKYFQSIEKQISR